MRRLISVRYGGGGSSAYEDDQRRALKRQQELQDKLDAIDMEYFKLREGNRTRYDQQIRPMEEGLLRRAAQPAREATSARARAGEYDAAAELSDEALARRNARYGISDDPQAGSADDDFIRAIALTAIGNQSKMSALETQNKLQQASMGIGTGVNADIGMNYGRAVQDMGYGLSHADAAFANYANAQGHLNNAYAAKQQGIGAMINAGFSVANMGVSNYQNAKYADALAGKSGANYGSSWLTGKSTGGFTDNWSPNVGGPSGIF